MATTAGVESLDGPKHAPGLAGEAAPTLVVHRTLAAAEPDWRRLEAEGAVSTPYQRFAWIVGWQAAAEAREELVIVVSRLGERPVALLPLVLSRQFGARWARIPGSEIGNADWMVLAPDAAGLFIPAQLRQMLLAASDAVGGIDIVGFFNLPPSWQGFTNPLLGFAHAPGPNRLHLGQLNAGGSFDRLDDKRRANARRRKRKLAETAGEVVLRTAASVAEVDRFHAAFLAQREARFRQMGIANVFAEPRFQRFFRAEAIAGLGEKRPALLIQALCAGERIVATAVGAISGRHYSQYINATSGDEDIVKFRLIGMLMAEVFADAAERGCTTIDMGLGDFDYKADFTVGETVYDAVVPLSLRGRVLGGLLLAARRLKRAVKQHDRLWTLARRLRSALGRRRPEPPREA